MAKSSSPETSGDTAEAPPDAELIRRRLRTALARARDEADLTQREAAELLGWSSSKVLRIEQGVHAVSPADVGWMLKQYAVTPADEADELVDMASEAQKARSWDEYREVMTPSFRELVGQEGTASHIWKHEPTFVPGLMQTPRYTDAALAGLGRTGEDKRQRAELRAKRQQLLNRDQFPELHYVVGEAVLRRPVGGSEVMREQIDRLVELSRHERINLYLLPFKAGPHPTMGVAFTILQFDLPDLDDVLFLEDGDSRSRSSEDPERLELFFEYYNTAQDMAEAAGPFAKQAALLADELY